MSKSKLGYSLGSPYRGLPFIDITTPQGLIDMSNTDIPLLAVDEFGDSRMLEPFSGLHKFRGNTVREIPLFKRGGDMIKRKDGSYSRRGLWDNIRANRGSGKKPTKEMLHQERKIRNEYQKGGTYVESNSIKPFYKDEEDKKAYQNQLYQFYLNEVKGKGSVPVAPYLAKDRSKIIDPKTNKPVSNDSNTCIDGVCGIMEKAGKKWNYGTVNGHYVGNETFHDSVYGSFDTKTKSKILPKEDAYAATGNFQIGDIVQASNAFDKNRFVPYDAKIIVAIEKDEYGNNVYITSGGSGGNTLGGSPYTESQLKDLINTGQRKVTRPGYILDQQKLKDTRITNPEAIKAINERNKLWDYETGKGRTNWNYSLRPDAKDVNPNNKIVQSYLSYANDPSKIEQLAKKLNVSIADVHDEILNTFGELAQETKFGSSLNPETIAEGMLVNLGLGKDKSVGPGQIRLDGLSEELKQMFNLTNAKDLYDPEKFIPLMTAMNVRNRQYLKRKGENLSKDLMGVPGVDWQNIKYGIGRWTPYTYQSSTIDGPENLARRKYIEESFFDDNPSDEDVKAFYNADPNRFKKTFDKGSYASNVFDFIDNNLQRTNPYLLDLKELPEVEVTAKKKFQEGGTVPPFVTSDVNEFNRRNQAYQDSLSLYKSSNLDRVKNLLKQGYSYEGKLKNLSKKEKDEYQTIAGVNKKKGLQKIIQSGNDGKIDSYNGGSKDTKAQYDLMHGKIAPVTIANLYDSLWRRNEYLYDSPVGTLGGHDFDKTQKGFRRNPNYGKPNAKDKSGEVIRNFFGVPIYKKPVQRVILKRDIYLDPNIKYNDKNTIQKPIVKKPIIQKPVVEKPIGEKNKYSVELLNRERISGRPEIRDFRSSFPIQEDQYEVEFMNPYTNKVETRGFSNPKDADKFYNMWEGDKVRRGKFQNGGLIKAQFGVNQLARESTAVSFYDPLNKRMVSTASTGMTPTQMKESSESMGRAKNIEKQNLQKRIAERKSAVAAKDKKKPFTLPDGKTKTYDQMDWREQSYVDGKALELRGRFNENDESWYDDINPLNLIGSMAGSLGQAPYEARQSNSIMPYVTSAGIPLLLGRAMSSGSINPFGKKFWTNTGSTRNFVNNLVNPIAGMELSSIGKKSLNLITDQTNNLGNKYLPNAYKYNPWAFKPNPEAYYRGIGRTGLDDALESGYLRANNNKLYGEDVFMTPEFNMAKGQYSRNQPYSVGDFWGDDWKMVEPVDSKSYIAEIPKNKLNNPEVKGELVIVNKGALPIDDVKLYKEDWLRGYKPIEVPQPSSVSSSVDDVGNKFKSEIDWSKWNKEIPDNPQLMQEYNAIEQQAKANGSWMKNPDGSPFQGTPEQFVQQNSENFKKAFGNSKLVNPDGSPWILEHGSPKKFDTFDESKFQLGDAGYSGSGIYTVPPKGSANSYTISGRRFHTGDIEPTIYKLYGQGNNPITSEELIKLGANSPAGKEMDLFNFHRKSAPLNEQLLDYDVAIHNQNRGIARVRDLDDAWEVVFPTNKQLKSAIGNNGMFDMTNPNIYKALFPALMGAGAASSQQEKTKYQKGGSFKNPTIPVYNEKQVIIPRDNFSLNAEKIGLDKALELDRFNSAKQKQGQIRKAKNYSKLEKALDIALNPLTAASYKVKGQDIPDNFGKGERNIYDNAIDMINPVSIVNSGLNTVGDLGSGLGALATGNLDKAGSKLLSAGLSAVDLLPLGISKASSPLLRGIPYTIKNKKYRKYGEALAHSLADHTADVIAKAPGINTIYKDLAHKVGSYSSGEKRTMANLKDILRNKQGNLKKYGNYTGAGVDQNRNLLRNYIYGDNTGFEPSDLTTDKFDKYINKYGDLKKYKLDNSKLQGNDIYADDLSTELYDKVYPKLFDETNRILLSEDEKNKILRKYLRKKDLSYTADVNPSLGQIGYDDIQGHVKSLRFDKKSKKYMAKTQDIWKFDPEDYIEKYKHSAKDKMFDSYILSKQAKLMERAGKPFILLDERPISFRSRYNGPSDDLLYHEF